jgi:methionyl-tRNA synthetase
VAGKDNLRQQSAMWQAMLMSAGLPNSKQIIIHGFITSAGQKMSKSLGNVIDPFEIVEKYGTDALRYWIAREANTFEDSDFTWERFKESYNANLANGLGNLVSRIVKMAIVNNVIFNQTSDNDQSLKENPFVAFHEYLHKFEIQKAIDMVWTAIGWADTFIQRTEPFKLIKTDPSKAKKDIKELLRQLDQIAGMLAPFLPATSNKILNVLKDPKLENVPHLFPRIE